MRKIVTCTALSLALIAGGCASSAESIKSARVSQVRYADHSCSQIAQEMEEVDAALVAVSSDQNDNAAADAALMTVGMIIFWPALFGLAATNDYGEQIAQLKGEKEALVRAAIRKDCAADPAYEDLIPDDGDTFDQAPEVQRVAAEVQ